MNKTDSENKHQLEQREQPNPIKHAIWPALLTLFACGGLTTLCGATDSTGTHLFYYFWHSDSTHTELLVPVVGLVAATIVFVNVWLLSRYSGGTEMLLPVESAVVGGVIGLVVGTLVAVPVCNYLPSWRGDPCSFWSVATTVLVGFGIGFTIVALWARPRIQGRSNQ